MKTQLFPMVLLALMASSACLPAAGPDAGFGAYHTRLGPPPGGDIGKYEDLVVTLDATNRFEFLRANGYLPQWRTKDGVHAIPNLFPDADPDPNSDYSYVRLLENGPDTPRFIPAFRLRETL